MFERSEIIFGMRSALKSLSVSLKRMFRKINGYGSDTVNDADKYVSLGFRKNLPTRYYFCFTGDLDSAQKWGTPVTE